MITAFSTTTESERPRDDELDLFGLTHAGKVRRDNQDQFLLATIHPQVVLHATSLAGAQQLPLRGERVATLMMVADGVGGVANVAEGGFIINNQQRRVGWY